MGVTSPSARRAKSSPFTPHASDKIFTFTDIAPLFLTPFGAVLRSIDWMRIFLPLILLLLVLGAWRAWRRSPIYSLKTNCQLAGVFLAMVAAIVLVTLGIDGGPAGRSSAAKIALVIPAILLLLTGAIAVTFRITDGPLAHLPRGVSVCQIHRRRLFPWVRGMTILLVIVSVTAMLVPARWMGLPLALGGLVLLLGTSILYPLYLKARRFDRGMTALSADPWIHWHYSPEQWQSWAAIQRSWERARTPVFRWKRDWSKLIFPVAILATAPWILGDGGTAQKVGVMLACVVVLLRPPGSLYGRRRLIMSFLIEATAESERHCLIAFPFLGGAIMSAKRIGILTGGGDVPGLNSVIKTVVYRGRRNRL
jgi:uncharacterized membrane protein SirB2